VKSSAAPPNKAMKLPVHVRRPGGLMSRDTVRTLLLAGASVAAVVLAQALAHQPVDSPPAGRLWRLLSLAPLVVLVIGAGVVCSGAKKVPLYALAIALPTVLLQVGRGLYGQPGYWLAVGVRLVACMALVGVAYVAMSAYRARRLDA